MAGKRPKRRNVGAPSLQEFGSIQILFRLRGCEIIRSLILSVFRDYRHERGDTKESIVSSFQSISLLLSRSRIQSSNRQRVGSISSNSSSSEIYLAHGELYYWPTMVSLLTLGLINVMSAKFYGPIGSILALLNFFVSLEWTNLHSEKLTRKEVSQLSNRVF